MRSADVQQTVWRREEASAVARTLDDKVMALLTAAAE
jgi:hypothetical protein